ncbi:MAG: hypothetical protein QNJ20_13690 [Paracoccaceae bacterium]|nr:hypothetical protein [Paracoccaceae bacterium]
MRLALFLSLFALPAMAQDGLRASDQLLDAAEMGELLNGQMIEFFDGSKSRYATDGRYAYTYTDDGPEWKGQYQVFDDSLVCVDFDNGSQRCDRLVRAGERLVLVIEDGTRFPVRNRTVYGN